MNVLVAGGAGFIGSHLIDVLLDKGNKVICIDNFFNGTEQNIAHLKDNLNFVFYKADLCDYSVLSQIFKKHNIDYVFHLAANSDIQASAALPAIEYQNTYTTTFHLLEGMRQYGVRKLFFASTSAVYGEKEGLCVNEDAPSLKPISYYGGAKLGSEALIEAYTYMNDFSSLVFRFPNLIGPRLTHGVIYDFIRKLSVNQKSLKILGDGNQSKPYMYVDDLIDGIFEFINSPPGVTLYNIGVDSQTSVNRIADIVCQTMGLESVLYEYTGGRAGWKGDVPVFAYDLTKIHEAGWHAKYTSDEAVAKTCFEVLKCRR